MRSPLSTSSVWQKSTIPLTDPSEHMPPAHRSNRWETWRPARLGQVAALALATLHPAAVPSSCPDPTPAGPGSRSAATRSATNAVLAVRWQLADTGLAAGGLRLGLAVARCRWPVSSSRSWLWTGRTTRPPRSDSIPGRGRSAWTRTRPPAVWPGASRRAGASRSRSQVRDGRLAVLWRAVARDGANYFRQEIEIAAVTEGLAIAEVTWLDAALPGARVAGRVDGSPIVAGDLFLGIEDPMAPNEVGPDHRVRCRLGAAPRWRRTSDQRPASSSAWRRRARCGGRSSITWSASGRIRTARSCTTTPGTTSPGPVRAERDQLPRGHPALRRAVHQAARRGHGRAWCSTTAGTIRRRCGSFTAGFPHGFAPLAELCRQYRTRLGVWLSPFGGYGEPKEQRLKFGREQGYETNATGFSLAGPKYYAAFKRACVGMIREYGVNHFKFDGIAAGMYAERRRASTSSTPKPCAG